MPPRKIKTDTPAPVVVTAPATVTVACEAPAAVPVVAGGRAKRASGAGPRTFRILTEGPHSVVALAGSPAPVFDGPATGKKSSDRRVVQAATPGQASKKAFTKLVRLATSKGDPDRNLSYRFTIQEVREDGKEKVHTYQGARTLLAEQKSVTRKGKDGVEVTIPIKYDVKVSAAKDATGASGTVTEKAPRKPRAPKAAAVPVAAPAAVETAAPKGRGKGKGAK